MAPEVYSGCYKGCASDMWSAGVVLYAMLFGCVPFKGSDTASLREQVNAGVYYINENISDKAKDLISRLLEINPTERISALDALNHPWLLESFDSKMNIFNSQEEELFKCEFSYTNRRNDENYFTELDIENDNTLKNNSTKSVILAPFNTTIDENSSQIETPEIEDKAKIRFLPMVKYLDRDYEKNYNNEVDNGVYNKLISGNTPYIKFKKSDITK